VNRKFALVRGRLSFSIKITYTLNWIYAAFKLHPVWLGYLQKKLIGEKSTLLLNQIRLIIKFRRENLLLFEKMHPDTIITQTKISIEKRRITNMRTGRTLLQIIGLTFIILLLAGCGGKPTESAAIDFTGHWEDVSSTFSLDLSQSGEQLQGSHVVVAQEGNKIDSLDKSIEGNINGHNAEIKFQSSFSTNGGTAQITFIDPNTIFWKMTTLPDGEYYLPAQATLVKKAAAAANPSPAATGTITGRVHLVAPPMPPMVVYAVDPTTGAWGFAETEASDGEAPFSITVPPGTYQVFAAVASDSSIGVGYTLDHATLATIPVTANQTVSDIVVRPPGQSECGATMGYPASPDGRFTGRPGPTAECIDSIQSSDPAPALAYAIDAVRIQFQPNGTSWYTNGDLAPNASIYFVISAMQGQQMNVNLITEPDSSVIPYASLSISGADGVGYTFAPTTSWSGILPVSQDYYIGVLSMSPQSMTYQLNVEIPVVPNAPAAVDSPKIAKDQLIRFAVGPLDVELNGTVISGERDRYSLSMLAGEILDVQITSLEGNAVFSILGPDQVALPGTEEGKDTMLWAVPIPADGAYSILVGPTRGNATYTLKVRVSE
jgi:hypothetical protein